MHLASFSNSSQGKQFHRLQVGDRTTLKWLRQGHPSAGTTPSAQPHLSPLIVLILTLIFQTCLCFQNYIQPRSGRVIGNEATSIINPQKMIAADIIYGLLKNLSEDFHPVFYS